MKFPYYSMRFNVLIENKTKDVMKLWFRINKEKMLDKLNFEE
jgi:hypothetical protein